MRKKYGFVMDSVAFYSRPWIVRSQVLFEIQRDVLVHVDVDLAEIIELVVSQDNSCRCGAAAADALRAAAAAGASRRSPQPETARFPELSSSQFWIRRVWPPSTT
jgi:hypothetical protein